MTSVSWDDDDQDAKAISAVRWKGRTLINFVVGRSRVRALPVVIHFLPEDIEWFSSVSCTGFIPTWYRGRANREVACIRYLLG